MEKKTLGKNEQGPKTGRSCRDERELKAFCDKVLLFPSIFQISKPDGIYDMCMTAKLKIMKSIVRHFERTGATQGLKMHAYQFVPSTNDKCESRQP